MIDLSPEITTATVFVLNSEVDVDLIQYELEKHLEKQSSLLETIEIYHEGKFVVSMKLHQYMLAFFLPETVRKKDLLALEIAVQQFFNKKYPKNSEKIDFTLTTAKVVKY